MANRPKNNFSDKLKRLGCNQLNKQNKTKSKLSIQQSVVGLVREKDQFIEQRISGQILDEMRRQIDVLQHKLMQAQREREKKDVQIELLSLKIGQKNVQSTYLTQELAESHRSIEFIKKKLEYAQSELQNIKLRQKMESISTEISKEKPINSPLKHQKHRKGKFSEAILPAAFGSQKKFEFHNPDLLVKDQVIQEQTPKNHDFLRSPFSGYLIEEWQRTQNQRNCKQLQVANLESKIGSLKREIIKQQKQIETLKSDKPSGHELAAALQQARQQNRRHKLVLLKLRESEKKRKELSNLLKLKGQIVEEDKFFGFSTIADINEMIQKSAQSLSMDYNVIDIILQPVCKKSQETQTSQADQSNQKNQFCLTIQQLRQRLKRSEQQMIVECNKVRDHYEQVINEYVSLIQHHQAKLQHYERIISKGKSEQQLCLTKHDVSSQCSILSYSQFQQQAAIVSKIHLLMTVNEQCQLTIRALSSQKQQLVKQIAFLGRVKDTNDKIIQVEDKIFNLRQQSQSQCPLCLQISQRYGHLQQQMLRVNRIVDRITQERNHFKHCYEESETSYRQLEVEMQQQLNKLKGECQQKEQANRLIMAELLQKTQQADHYQQQSHEFALKLQLYQELKTKNQEKIQYS